MSGPNAAEALGAAKVEVMGGVVPYLNVEGAAKAAAFYERAFGAVIAAQHPSDDKGRTMHIHLHLNGGSVMLSDFFPEQGMEPKPVQAINLMLPVADIESAYRRAIEAGATATMPPAKMFWGDIYGELKDPFGVTWSMNQAA